MARRHGEIFAKVFLAEVGKSESPHDAFDLSGVMDWPRDDEDDSPAHMRYGRIESEILRRVFDEIEGPLRDAFTSIARDVIERERRRQERGKG